eukprot:m.64307 g.64307  ORF g.64307 m.64307 type:complete len:131 (-) comp13576_c0_seq2:377-769(-)
MGRRGERKGRQAGNKTRGAGKATGKGAAAGKSAHAKHPVNKFKGKAGKRGKAIRARHAIVAADVDEQLTAIRAKAFESKEQVMSTQRPVAVPRVKVTASDVNAVLADFGSLRTEEPPVDLSQVQFQSLAL